METREPKEKKSTEGDQWGFIRWVVRKLLAVIIVLILLLFGSNMAWLLAFQSYDYSSEVVQQDGSGVNNYNNNIGGDVSNGANDKNKNPN